MPRKKQTAPPADVTTATLEAPPPAPAPDAQALFDAEQARDFRRLLARMTAPCRQRQGEERKRKEAARKLCKARKRAEAELERVLEDATPDVEDLAFVQRVQSLLAGVEAAQTEEAEARAAWREAKVLRRQSQLDLQVSVKRWSTPAPLFDRPQQ